MLSDSERNEYFDRKSKEVIERFLGKDNPYPIPDPITVRYTSDCSINGPWYGRPRVIKNPNIDQQSQEYLAWYNQEMHKTNGRIVTHVEGGLDDAVPDPIK